MTKKDLKGVLHSRLKITSQKIINIFFKKKNNNPCILKKIVQGSQNDIEILVNQEVFKLYIKNSQNTVLINYSQPS